MKKLLVFLILGIVTISCQAEEIDDRQVLQVTAVQRGHILNEMRTLLSGTQAILIALAKEDMVAVSRHAKALGMGMARKAENSLKGTLPKAFMQLGMAAHQDFDQIAADAESIHDPKHTLRQLSQSMGKCIVCHESYQISTLKSL